MIESITSALVRINNNYGRGDIVGVIINDTYTGGTVIRQLAKHGRETRVFRFSNMVKTVFYEGHQRKLA